MSECITLGLPNVVGMSDKMSIWMEHIIPHVPKDGSMSSSFLTEFVLIGYKLCYHLMKIHIITSTPISTTTISSQLTQTFHLLSQLLCITPNMALPQPLLRSSMTSIIRLCDPHPYIMSSLIHTLITYLCTLSCHDMMDTMDDATPMEMMILTTISRAPGAIFALPKVNKIS